MRDFSHRVNQEPKKRIFSQAGNLPSKQINEIMDALRIYVQLSRKEVGMKLFDNL